MEPGCGMTARSGIALALSVACMAAVLGACGEESPGASSPTPSASTSPTKPVAPSPQKVAAPRKKRLRPLPSIPASAALSPGRCVTAAPPTTTSPTLDSDVCQVIVGYTRDWVVVEAKLDPAPLSQGEMSFRGYFDAPSSALPGETGRFWQWRALFPMGVRESHQFTVFNPFGGVYGCGAQGMGHGYVPTATANRKQGIIQAAFPSPCISEQGVFIPPDRSERRSISTLLGPPTRVRKVRTSPTASIRVMWPSNADRRRGTPTSQSAVSPQAVRTRSTVANVL